MECLRDKGWVDFSQRSIDRISHSGIPYKCTVELRKSAPLKGSTLPKRSLRTFVPQHGIEPLEATSVIDTRLENPSLLLSGIGVQTASSSRSSVKLCSGFSELDDFFDGGLPVGTVTEWGVPFGCGGRNLVVSWLAHLHARSAHEAQPQWTLWAYSKSQLNIYPPAWQARGVNLACTRFACSAKPMADLRPVFMEPLFRVIVLDAPRHFTEDDFAFVARRARKNKQVVIVLRDYFLGSKRGNIWARLRLNTWLDVTARQFRLRVVRGLSPRQLALEESLIERPAYDQHLNR